MSDLPDESVLVEKMARAMLDDSIKRGFAVAEIEPPHLVFMDQAQAALSVLRPFLDRLRDCETSLAIFDDGHDSEYWLRYPAPTQDTKGEEANTSIFFGR